MNDIAIRVENLSKLYRIGAKQERYKTLRDNIQTFQRSNVPTFQRSNVPTFQRSNSDNTIWALKDVSLAGTERVNSPFGQFWLDSHGFVCYFRKRLWPSARLSSTSG